MPSGRLGASDLSAATNTSVYTVPASKVGSFSVNFCNRGSAPALVRLAVASTASPAVSEWLLYDAVVEGRGALERTGLVAQAGMQVIAYASAAGVSAVAYGFEE